MRPPHPVQHTRSPLTVLHLLARLTDRINTTFGLKKYLNSVEQELYPKKPTPHSKQQLRALYMFLFPFLKEEGQKSLPGDMAIAVLSIVLAPKYPVAKSFVEYAQVSQPGRNEGDA